MPLRQHLNVFRFRFSFIPQQDKHDDRNLKLIYSIINTKYTSNKKVIRNKLGVIIGYLTWSFLKCINFSIVYISRK